MVYVIRYSDTNIQATFDRYAAPNQCLHSLSLYINACCLFSVLQKKFQADFSSFSSPSLILLSAFSFHHYILLAAFFHSIFFLYLSLSLSCTHPISSSLHRNIGIQWQVLKLFFSIGWCCWFEFGTCTIHIKQYMDKLYIRFYFVHSHWPTGEVVRSKNEPEKKIKIAAAPATAPIIIIVKMPYCKQLILIIIYETFILLG